MYRSLFDPAVAHFHTSKPTWYWFVALGLLQQMTDKNKSSVDENCASECVTAKSGW